MLRFFGMLIGIICVGTLALTWYSSNYSYDDLVAEGENIIQDIQDKIQPEEETASAVQVVPVAAPIQETTVVVPTSPETVIQQETVSVSQEAVVIAEEPDQINIFWGPFSTKTAASGFAKRAKDITGQNTEIVEEAPGKILVAFVGKEAAIAQALKVFEERTGMEIQVRQI